MDIRHDTIAAIGHTPLIRLKRASELTGCEILGKAEFMNPGQSVKDRAALHIVKDAIARGQLKPGGTIVEGTAGNTGIGLAVVGNALGFKTVIVIPETQSQEKKDALRLMGAQLLEVPAKPYRDPDNYVKISGRLAEQLAKTEPNGAVWANQFDNVANRQAHVETTGPEIWEQTQGRIDGFTAAVGTGGTLAGVAIALKSRNPEIRIAAADPLGRGDLFLDQDRRTANRMAARSPKASARTGSPPIWMARRSTTPMRFPMKRCCRCCSICSSMKACAWAARPASISPAPSAWQRTWAPATPS